MALSESVVLEALRVVQDPDLHRDIVTLGFVKNVVINGGDVAFKVELTTPEMSGRSQSVSSVVLAPARSMRIGTSARQRRLGSPSPGSSSSDRTKGVHWVALNSIASLVARRRIASSWSSPSAASPE
jgi:hypothetical protein